MLEPLISNQYDILQALYTVILRAWFPCANMFFTSLPAMGMGILNVLWPVHNNYYTGCMTLALVTSYLGIMVASAVSFVINFDSSNFHFLFGV